MKKPSTITMKPLVDPKLESWITGSNENVPDAPSALSPKSQPASQPAGQQASMEGATRMLSVRIPADLHQQLRVYAVSQSLQIQDIVTQLLQGYLAEER